MWVVDFGWCGFGYTQGSLYGEFKQYPVSVLRLGLVAISSMPGRSRRLLHNALEGLARDRDYLIKTAARRRLETKRERSRRRAEARWEYEEQVEYLQEQVSRLTADLREAQGEARQLKVAAEVMMRLREESA